MAVKKNKGGRPGFKSSHELASVYLPVECLQWYRQHAPKTKSGKANVTRALSEACVARWNRRKDKS